MYFTAVLTIMLSMLVVNEAATDWSTSRCTCTTGKAPMDIYDKTDNTGVFRTECVTGSFTLTPTSRPVGDETQACYIKCADKPCTKTPTVECVKIADMKTDKPGKCPDNDIQTGTRYVDNCQNDKECKGQQKCCQQQPSGKKKCINPVATGQDKCGACQPYQLFHNTISPFFYDRECKTDDMCTDDAKCCAFTDYVYPFAQKKKCYSVHGNFELS